MDGEWMEGEMVEVLSVLKLHCFPSKETTGWSTADETKGLGTVTKERGEEEGRKEGEK